MEAGFSIIVTIASSCVVVSAGGDEWRAALVCRIGGWVCVSFSSGGCSTDICTDLWVSSGRIAGTTAASSSALVLEATLDRRRLLVAATCSINTGASTSVIISSITSGISAACKSAAIGSVVCFGG